MKDNSIQQSGYKQIFCSLYNFNDPVEWFLEFVTDDTYIST